MLNSKIGSVRYGCVLHCHSSVTSAHESVVDKNPLPRDTGQFDIPVITVFLLQVSPGTHQPAQKGNNWVGCVLTAPVRIKPRSVNL